MLQKRMPGYNEFASMRDPTLFWRQLYVPAQFACFTGTKVQIYNEFASMRDPTLFWRQLHVPAQFACFTGTKVQIWI
jgi:hypothetical protein